MTDDNRDQSEIKDSDIVFDCPHCSKSLAIDYRGAGLSIPCSDCGKSVEVPIPDGMELADIDSTEEEQEIRILHLRRALGISEARIQELEGEVEDLTARRETLEEARMSAVRTCRLIEDRMKAVDRALRDIREAIGEMGEEPKP